MGQKRGCEARGSRGQGKATSDLQGPCGSPPALCWRSEICGPGCLSSGSRSTWSTRWSPTASVQRQGTGPWPGALWNARSGAAGPSRWNSGGPGPTRTHTAAWKRGPWWGPRRSSLTPGKGGLHPGCSLPSKPVQRAASLHLSIPAPWGPLGLGCSRTSLGERGPGGTSHTHTTTHILVFIGNFTWILALLSGEVDHLASQICQGVLDHVSGVGGAGDGDVVLQRPVP